MYSVKYIFIYQFTECDWISMLLGKGEQTLSDKRTANIRNVSFQRHKCKVCRHGKFKSWVLRVRDIACAKSELTYTIIIMDSHIRKLHTKTHVANCPRNS